MLRCQAEEMEGRPRSQPDDLINFRQLRSNALQAAELDIYDGDDIRSATPHPPHARCYVRLVAIL